MISDGSMPGPRPVFLEGPKLRVTVHKSQKLATFFEIVVNICDFGYFVTFGHS